MDKTTSIAPTFGRPEDELLVRCARVSRAEEGRIRVLLAENLDWEYLLKSAGDHGVTPLLFRHLGDEFRDLVPEDVVERLRGEFEANRLRNLMLAGELLAVCAAFERHGVPAVPYKGPSLAASAYGNLALRKSGDLDILVRRRDFPEARDLLVSRGYEPTPWLTTTWPDATQLSPEQEAAFLRFEREYALTRADTGISVELQWEVVPRYFAFSLDLDALGARLRRVSIGGGDVPAPAPEDLLLILCVHGSKHFWERLIWVSDVAEMVRSHREMDWHGLMERANALGSERMLMLGLSLAHDLLGTALPEKVVREMRSDPTVGKLAGEVCEALFRESEGVRDFLDGSAFHPFHYRMRERRWDRIGYLIRLIIAPNESDWMERPLPARLMPLYFVLKPLRMVRKYGQRLLKRASR